MKTGVNSQKRKLVAIMFTDIVAFSQVMKRDEKAAMALLNLNRSIHDTFIRRFDGRFVKEMGDGILAVFESSSDAILCASSIQRKAGEQNISLRIALHDAEVVMCNGDILGDGVNLAAHLEPLANPGEVLATDATVRDLWNKEGISITYIGDPYIDHATQRWRIYRVEVNEEKIEEVLCSGGRSKQMLPFTASLMKWGLPIILIGTTGGAVGTISGAVSADMSRVLLGCFFLFYTLVSLAILLRGGARRQW